MGGASKSEDMFSFSLSLSLSLIHLLAHFRLSDIFSSNLLATQELPSLYQHRTHRGGGKIELASHNFLSIDHILAGSGCNKRRRVFKHRPQLRRERMNSASYSFFWRRSTNWRAVLNSHRTTAISEWQVINAFSLIDAYILDRRY